MSPKPSGLPIKPMSQAEHGLRGARKRWGVPRLVRLNGLTEEQREFVIETVQELRQAAQEITNVA